MTKAVTRDSVMELVDGLRMAAKPFVLIRTELESAISAIIRERDEAVIDFKNACGRITELESRDPDKRIADLETSLNELNSFDAPLEIQTLRADRDEWKRRAGEAEGLILNMAKYKIQDSQACPFCLYTKYDPTHAPDCIITRLQRGESGGEVKA